jgi:hypothetical protein
MYMYLQMNGHVRQYNFENLILGNFCILPLVTEVTTGP